jgi:hypothetical protein
MAKQNKLEEIAIAQRKALITNNTFNDEALANNYSATHTNAKSDETTPNRGKGTGVAFDTANGGSSQDINGVPNAVGSGRIANVLTNEYNADNDYKTPDMTGNIGQVTI